MNTTYSIEEITRNFFHERDINNIKEKIDSLKNSLLFIADVNNRLQKQVDELLNENWKDTKLQEIQQELNKVRADYNRGFHISEADDKKINQWILKHDEEIHHNYNHYHGASGGGFSYVFTPTGLGTIGTCFCDICRGRAIKEQPTGWRDYCKREFDGFIEFGDFG